MKKFIKYLVLSITILLTVNILPSCASHNDSTVNSYTVTVQKVPSSNTRFTQAHAEVNTTDSVLTVSGKIERNIPVEIVFLAM